MSTFNHTQFQWQAYKQGNDVWVRPVNPYTRIFNQANQYDEFEEFANQHTYPAPDLEDGRIYEGGELEIVHQYLHGGVFWGDSSYSDSTRTIIRLKQPATPTSEGKGEMVEEAAEAYIKPFAHQLHFGQEDSVKNDFISGAQWQSQHSQSLDIRRVLEYVAEKARMIYHDGHNKKDIPTSHHQSGADNIQPDRAHILALQPELEKMLKEK